VTAAKVRPFRFAVQSYSATSGADWRNQARQAEALGYSTFHLADHVIGQGPALAATNHPVQNLAAIPAIAVAAEATTTIGVGCRVFCVDYRNPVMLAKELATLDMFSDGRLEIGLGAGWLQGEYAAMGVPWKAAGVRLNRLEETVALLRASFADGELNIVGAHTYAVGFEAVPKPIGGAETRRDGYAGPRIMIGGGAQRVLGIAGRDADIVSLNFDNSSGKLGPAGVSSSTAELTMQKLEWIRAGAGARFADLEIEIGAYFINVTNDYRSGIAAMAGTLGIDTVTAADHPHVLVGSVGSICEQIIARRDQFGISYITVAQRNAESFAPIVAKLSEK
jgi:probable F420-dependent oxidoreductase